MGMALFPSMASLALPKMNKQKLDPKDSTYYSLQCKVGKKEIRGKKWKPQVQYMLRIVFTGVCGMIQQYGRTLHMLMHSVIDLNAFNSVRNFCSYSQHSWIVHFLQNLLSRSVVKQRCFLLASRKFSLTWCSQVRVIACQTAMSRTFKKISWAKARAPGELPKVVAMVVCMACILAVASASSIMSLA